MPNIGTQRLETARPEFGIVGVVADKSLVARLPPERIYGMAA